MLSNNLYFDPDAGGSFDFSLEPQQIDDKLLTGKLDSTHPSAYEYVTKVAVSCALARGVLFTSSVSFNRGQSTRADSPRVETILNQYSP